MSEAVDIIGRVLRRDEVRRALRWAYVVGELSDPTYLALMRGDRDVHPDEIVQWRKRNAERLEIALDTGVND